MSMPTNVITVIFGLFVYTAVTEKAYPQDLETEKALELITTTADKICSAVNTDGSSDSKKVTGAVNAQLNGLIRKLAGLGISGDGSYSADHYAGLIREDLPTALKNIDDCKLKVLTILQQKLITGPKSVSNRKNVSSCTSIAGNWYSSKYKAVIPIRQDGCSINSEFTVTVSFGSLNSEIYYELIGRAAGNKFEFTLKRTDLSNCTANFFGRLTAIEQEQMIAYIDRSSGLCGVAPDYTETQTLVRR